MKSSYIRAGVLSALVTGVVLPAAATHAQASDDEIVLEEIIVTAQKREENLQSTPIAVTAVSASALADMNVSAVGDISRVAPNVQFSGANQGFFFIRGIGQQQYGLLTDPGSTIYVDGVYRPRTVSNSINFGDLARLEVLRGPQGTLYGKNAVGGAVNIISTLPGESFGGKVDVQGGSRDRLKAGVALDLPIVSDTLLARVSFERDRQDGYMNNLSTGQELSNRNYYTARGTLLWKAADTFTVTLRSDYTHQDQKGPGAKLIATAPGSQVDLSPYVAPGQFDTYGTSPSYVRGTDKGASVTLEWEIGPGTLKSISAYREFTNVDADDADGTPVNAQFNVIDFDEHFFSEEVQYNAVTFNDTLNWTVGAFYMEEKAFDAQQGVFNVTTPFKNDREQTAESVAAFAQGTYQATSDFSVTLGMRYSRDDKEAVYNNYAQSLPGFPPTVVISPTPLVVIPLDDSWSAFTPKLALQYQFTPEIMAYATVSKGFKSGGFNETPIRSTDFIPFDQEVLWNYEAGLKSEWLDNRLRANFTVFRMNYDDIQINIETPATAQNGFSPSLFVANAGDARINGVEGEITFLPVPALLLNASFGVNDFEYRSLSQEALDHGVSYDKKLPHAAKYNASFGAEYRIELGDAGSVSLRGDYSWRDKFYLDAANSPTLQQDAYGLLGARATYMASSEMWSVFAYGTNLADEEYHSFGQLIQTNTVIYQGAPREIGVGVNVRFGQ